MKTCIYALVDPATATPRYVGQSTDPVGRIAAHASSSGAKAVRRWIASLDTAPLVLQLEWAETDCATDREGFWIRKLRAEGHKLLNQAKPIHPGSGSRPPRWEGMGTRIRSLRIATGLTGVELAERCGVRGDLISRLETGAREGCLATTAVAIARALGVSVDWLVTGEGSVEMKETA